MLASLTLGVLLSSVVLTGAAVHPARAQPSTSKPNFVFIFADDMRYDDMKYMPKTRRLLGGEGMTFSNAFISNSLCCPARATTMRGQYAHNTGVWTNESGPRGGWKTYKRKGYEKDNVATRLHRAGYRTALIGKYINGYDGSTVPKGWDKWFAKWADGSGGFYDYQVNDNGTKRRYGSSSSDYATDVLSRETGEFIGASVTQRKPFFAYVTPKAPHEPATPAPRHEHAYDGVRAPRPPSFNEKDVSDKPPWIRQLPRLSPQEQAQIDRRHELRAESLLALDDLVEAVVNRLRSSGQLDNTYIFFTSDNGWHEGEHRVAKGKGRPYEEDVRVPLLVRGPGIAADSVTSRMAINTDFMPTFTDLAGIRTPKYVDGRSLSPVLKGNTTSWRSAVLLEGPKYKYHGIRTSTDKKYVVYKGRKKEFYDLESDPYELRSKRSVPSWLSSRLKDLKDCRRAGCRRAEN